MAEARRQHQREQRREQEAGAFHNSKLWYLEPRADWVYDRQIKGE
jgi:hypothetical protein